MAQALHRKYRPKNLRELLGQDTNVSLLQNAARKKALGQAYLFYGPRGTGKTTTARLIAKLANCEKRATDPAFAKLGEPCNECRSCREIDENISLDVIEIDAASNRGIDEIKNLQEHLKAAPTAGPFKVYIIDEAHMLTTPAFNALLKTIEEPPTHAMFILATTEYEKLPATIVSRTQRFVFKKLPKIELMKKLEMISKEEKIDIEPAALELIAAAADGSFRDAESLLDQLRSAGKTITLAVAEEMTGRVGFQKVEALAGFLTGGNAKGALEYLAQASDEGHNLVELTRDLIHYLRKMLALRADPGLENHFKKELTADELARLKTAAAAIVPLKHIALMRALLRAYSEMKYSPFQTVPLEIAIIESASA